jgi:CHAD domain-containing protein
MQDFSSGQTLGQWGQAALAQHWQKIQKYDRKVLKDQDPEDLHQLRVGLRRLRTALVGFSPALVLPSGITERRVGKMARILGVLRDNDVLREILLSLGTLPEEEQGYLEDLLDYLGQKRKQAFKSVKKLLTQGDYEVFQDQFNAWLTAPALTVLADYPMTEVLPDLLLPRLAEFFLHPGWLVLRETNPHGTHGGPELSAESLEASLEPWEKTLHNLRKAAKKARYQLDLFTPCYSAEYGELIERLKSVQDSLGDLQDYFVLRQLLKKRLAADLASQAPEFSTRLAGKRLAAWKQWQPQQAYFLDPHHRRHCRLLGLSPL